ncbi:phosphatidylcholine and lysophosphatidylcholine phospholipase [Cryptotrichosporon argae]
MEQAPTLAAVPGNPFVALAAAAISAALYVLQAVRVSVGWLTISLPTMFVRVLQYSLTISLGFPHFVAMFVGVCGLLFVLIRYRYLTKYTQLKESALPPPSPETLGNTLPLPDDPLVDTGARANKLFHSYLDDFLSAIRIFGYLEKPVFHELSRHLQTRRLAAGDSMELGGGDFWCVVEGKVQVFAPSAPEDRSTPPSPDPLATTESFNGYHLINEVSTGGTLSSLFSILTLFTENIKLSWTPTETEDTGADNSVELRSPPPLLRSRANSDVSQLDAQTMNVPAGITSPPTAPMLLGRSNSMGMEPGTARATSPPPGQDALTSASQPVTSINSPLFTPSDPAIPSTTNSFKSPSGPQLSGNQSRSRAPSHKKSKPVVGVMDGTIARATVDTTLAVIPAEAFKKLTRKFPKASGAVVQVVLERFSRVTFMTAHKFLGLTREILRSESALNTLVSHPLPASFYTGGGMQTLRQRFQPELRHKYSPSGGILPGVQARDYFSSEHSPAKTASTRSSSPSVTTPKAKLGSFAGLTKINNDIQAPAPQATGGNLNVERPSPISFTRRTSAGRKQVAAGDLAMTSGGGQNSDAYFRPGPKTPGLPRMDTWRPKYPSSPEVQLNALHVEATELPDDSAGDGGDRFDLREAVVMSIAKSIGLAQPVEPAPADGWSRKSLAPSNMSSAPGSPMFPPSSRAANGRSHFGNVLDMMNASDNQDNVISGMLREGLADRADDASSVSASINDSHAGPNVDANAAISRDLESNVEILFFKKGSKLVKEGERSPGIYYVIDGFLDVSIPVHPSGVDTPRSSAAVNPSVAGPPTSSFSNVSGRPFGAALGLEQGAAAQPEAGPAEEHLFSVKPGGVAGYLASLCGTDSYVTITAKTDCFVGFLPGHALERITERRPIVLLTLAKRLLSLLSPLVLHIDAGLDWMQLGAGQVLYEKGDKSTDFYIVINGRLRSLTEKNDGVEVLREYGQNDSIGELEVITAATRPDTVQAIRDTELVRIPAALFDAISVRHPATTVQFMRLIASRVRGAVARETVPQVAGSAAMRTDMNLKTVCILGSNRNVPVAQFAGKLKASLEDMGATTSYLDQATVMRHLGRHAFSRIGKLKVAGWLADQEQHYRMVLYVADTPPSSQWTMTCIRQADLVLVLSMGDDPSLGEYEKLLLAMKTFARKELIMLHDERTVAPGSTRPWLKNRPWLHAHYHVELAGVITTTKAAPAVHDAAAVAAFKHLRERVETRIRKYRGLRPLHQPRRPPHLNDFARIARRLCGKQVGLVLGGGGARGISHIGMLQALEEFGVPVDAVAGCSIGAFVGGLYARETDLLATTGRTKQFAGRMGSMWRILSDVTYPFVAYTTGHEFNRGIYKAFYNTHIEDFWIPFFCNSTNITHSRMEIHRSGYAWRYVRASMTLAGLLPPLSDNGNLLVDGGYMDNTPIGPLRASGIRDIIVVDVGSVDDTSPRKFGDSVSGWWLFINRCVRPAEDDEAWADRSFNPFYKGQVPSMTEISSRLTYVSSVKTLDEVKNDPDCLYLAMPVQQFETLGGFKRFSEVLGIGLGAARDTLKTWQADGRLPHGTVDEGKAKTAVQRGSRLRRSSI